MSLKKIFLPILIGLIGCLLTAGVSLAETDAGEAETGEAFTPGFYYTIQKGDTLWDLSQRFYDSEWVWPALWGQNKDITNPHWIYPGNRIRLYQKSDLVDHQDKPEPEKRLPEIVEVKPEEEAPAPEPEEPEEPEELEELEPEIYFYYPQIANVGFIQKLSGSGLFGGTTDPLAIGEIFKAEGEIKQMISENDTVYIHHANNDNSVFIVGNLYSIYKPLVEINDPRTGDYAGHQYRIAGIVEVTEKNPAYVVARVVKSLRPIRVGDKIMPFQQRSKKIALQQSPEGMTGHVLLSEDHTRMSAGYDIVFLDKGKKDGVQAGQRYDVFYQSEKKINGETVLLPPITYGKLLVLLAKDTTATATVTQASKSIAPGDRFKTP
ncbi:MAG: LysM peptidoglycan-binding domain-containing protein [Desulfosudaceae bacterium]